MLVSSVIWQAKSRIPTEVKPTLIHQNNFYSTVPLVRSTFFQSLIHSLTPKENLTPHRSTHYVIDDDENPASAFANASKQDLSPALIRRGNKSLNVSVDCARSLPIGYPVTIQCHSCNSGDCHGVARLP